MIKTFNENTDTIKLDVGVPVKVEWIDGDTAIFILDKNNIVTLIESGYKTSESLSKFTANPFNKCFRIVSINTEIQPVFIDTITGLLIT